MECEGVRVKGNQREEGDKLGGEWERVEKNRTGS